MARGNQVPIPSQATSSNNSGGRMSFEDSSSPLFLQNGDHPGLVLVSHLLTGNDYNTWNRAISMALTAKNKFSFVDGTQLRPSSTDLLYASWIRCNSMVISWILNSVSREIADSLLYISTAYEIWNDLRDRFHQSNAPRVFQIKKLLTGLHQGSMDISSYYTKMRTLWDELKDFQPISEERQRSIHHDVAAIPGQSLVFNTSNVAAVRGAPTIKGSNFDRPICSHCHFPNHNVDKCYKLHGYPPSHPKYKQKQSEGKAHVNHARSCPDDILPTVGENLNLNPNHCRQLIAFLSSQL
ncbi:uncharacterized protein [Primulina eburnea]|uniref:uncharacterized protein n=1 Tax=Primulina eburnea TaxID=1245227 RepID=UPI003C6C7B68